MGVGKLTSPPERGWWFRERVVLRNEEWLVEAIFKMFDNQDGVETGPRGQRSAVRNQSDRTHAHSHGQHCVWGNNLLPDGTRVVFDSNESRIMSHPHYC